MRNKERKALKALSATARAAFDIIEAHEVGEIVGLSRLCQALGKSQIEFITFSCPKAARDREEVELDLGKTVFVERFGGQAKKLLGQIERVIPVRLTIIVPDLEPLRSWGWQTDQEEVTELWRMMIADGQKELPANWQSVLWSDLEARSAIDFESFAAHASRLAETERLAREYRQSAIRLTRLIRQDPRKHAQSKVVQYAYEGKALSELFPNAILIQSEQNAPLVKDRMYSLVGESLPIIHPFSL
ncbi:MAG: hypothetical protein OEV37_01880 [Candidatus Berkelbacteria bacterium]|nr:hypothetical protein [Candidatus Berkelbacteria bacterium]